ncbi:hypothetical protein IT575_10115 [bacterium]|nr:hypothetical protein [bacterium]
MLFYLRENYSDAPEPAPQPALPAALAEAGPAGVKDALAAEAPAKRAQSAQTSP